MAQSDRVRAYRASIVHSVGDPSQVGIEDSYEYYEDGLLEVSEGKIKALGHAHDLLPSLSHDTEVVDYQDSLIAPGFIDAHIHFPQFEIVASYGHQLLDWLNKHVFPAEARFVDRAHASTVARRFLDELLRNGTTTALVFGSSHMEAVDAFFEVASELGLRMIAGKALMDRNAPDSVTDTPESGYKDSAELIRRWHGKDRLSYAITPRFAMTCTSEQLRLAGELLAEHPGVYLHTHLSENKKEIEVVAELFPEHRDYLSVYDHYKLVGPRSVFAHGVHLTDEECARLGQSGAAVAFCPTSNLFLGSGLLDLPRLEAHGVNVGLGTDVGGGTSFSLLQTLNEAYKVMQLQGHKLHPFKSLYLATLGGARALRLDDRIGSFDRGNEADFVVLDYKATPLIGHRIERASNLEEKLFVLMMLGDDRCVKETFAAGKSVHKRSHFWSGHHHPEPQQPYQAPHGSQYPQPIQGEIVKIYCEANPDFFLAGRNGSVVMAPANESDPSQQWIMDTSWSVKAKDDEGFPAFALVNKATGQALRHGRAEKDKVTLGPYHPDDLNEAVLFTQSADVGKGYQCIRPVHNTHLNLDASTGDDKHHVALREGAEIVLCKWNKKESQKWKISPILGASQGVHPPRGEQSSFYPPQANVEPQGHTVRIHCEANPEFFLAARGDVAVLALENPHDPHQQWIKVDSWGLRVKDEAGFPAFALVNKATRHALKHGDKEWDQIFLADYNHDKAEQSVLWTLSADVGNGYQCLRPVNNINLNMDAKAADGHVGGIRDGNELILFEWKKQSNQKWKLQPIH